MTYCPEQFTESNGKTPDRELPTKLKGVSSAILAWAVQGCLEWQRNGLQEPNEVKNATAEYKEEQDILGDFITEKCEEGDEFEVKARELYNVYTAWCITENINPQGRMTETAFGTKMGERGFKKKRQSGGKFYKGVTVKKQKDNLTVMHSEHYQEKVAMAGVSRYNVLDDVFGDDEESPF